MRRRLVDAMNLLPYERDKILKFYDDHADQFESVCAGVQHHHYWVGGLLQHCIEMCDRGITDMFRWAEDFKGKFTKSDLIICIFLHDFPKIIRYRLIEEDERDPKSPKFIKGLAPEQVFTRADPDAFKLIDEESWLLKKLADYHVHITDEQWSAILFAEGAWSKSMWEFSGPSKLGQDIYKRNPLATFLHMLDMWSSQILGGSPSTRNPNNPFI